MFALFTVTSPVRVFADSAVAVVLLSNVNSLYWSTTHMDYYRESRVGAIGCGDNRLVVLFVEVHKLGSFATKVSL